MTRVTVFGGAGFVGSHVVDELRARGSFDIRVFDQVDYKYGNGVENIRGNILDRQAVARAIEGSEYVYNFAGIADLDSASTMASETAELNILGNINILEGCRAGGVRKMLYASTIYVYSDKGGFYRCSKQASEMYIEEFQRKYGLHYTILRYGTLYGPRSTPSNSIHSLIWTALTHKKISYRGTGDEVREYIHVRDAAKLSVETIDPRYDNRYIIVTGHNPMKVTDMLEMLREVLGREITIEKMMAKDVNGDHYSITPYSFRPRIGYKMVSNEYLDFGQGLLECIQEIHEKYFHEG